jgi:hypothetical protein
MGFDCRFDKTEIINKLGELRENIEQKLLASLFNTSVTANTDILTTDLAPSKSPVLFRVYATFNASGVLSVVRKRGTTSVVEQLNSGNPLSANCAFMFDIIVEQGETINLRYSVNATCLVLKVVETRW